MSRRVIVELSEAEARAILRAIGNSLSGDPDDEHAIVGNGMTIAAAYRARDKIESAYYGKKKA